MRILVVVVQSLSCVLLLRPHRLPGSSVYGTLQARILEWVAISFSRESYWYYWNYMLRLVISSVNFISLKGCSRIFAVGCGGVWGLRFSTIRLNSSRSWKYITDSMASPIQWTWLWVNSGSWWWTRRPGVLPSMGSQRVGHDWPTELNWVVILTFLLVTFVFPRIPNTPGRRLMFLRMATVPKIRGRIV